MIGNWDEFLFPYNQAVDEICLKFKNIKNEFLLKGKHSPIESVDGRVKKIGSIIGKANKKNIPYDKIHDKIEDIAGIRVNCRFVEDIEKVVELIHLRSDYDMLVLQEKDYIKNTKTSGYRSYHVLVKYNLFTMGEIKEISCEIQIRTLAMNFWATIEHSLNYKYNGNMPEELKKRLQVSAEASFRLDTEMSTIREEIMEAQKIVEVKNRLVDEILKKLQALHYTARMEKVNELNRTFFELYEIDDMEQLQDFNRKLSVMTELYKAY